MIQEADCRLRVARAIWLAMVNDEAPDDETLNREGYLDAADAVLGLLVPRSEAEALAEALEEALEFAAEGWAYAGDYFVTKWRAREREDELSAKVDAYRAKHPKET